MGSGPDIHHHHHNIKENPNQQLQQQPQQITEITQSRPNIIRTNRNGKRSAAVAALTDDVVPKPITLVLIKTMLPSDGGHN